MWDYLKVLKLIDIQHIDKVSMSKRKEDNKHGKILFAKRNKKIKL